MKSILFFFLQTYRNINLKMIIAAFFSAQLKSNGITELVFTKWERKVVTCYNIELFDAVK